MTQIEALKSILMKIINRHLELESEVRVLRVALNRKGIVTDEEFTEAESIAKRAEEDLLKFDAASAEELLEEILLKFQGPKQ